MERTREVLATTSEPPPPVLLSLAAKVHCKLRKSHRKEARIRSQSHSEHSTDLARKIFRKGGPAVRPRPEKEGTSHSKPPVMASAAVAAACALAALRAVRIVLSSGRRRRIERTRQVVRRGAISAQEYFSTARVPSGAETEAKRMQEFVATQARSGRRVVCVTGGGTTVPLEENTVRFIDNFSTGRRAATSVEYFLERGYAVLYVRRTGSVDAFARHVQRDMRCKGLDSKLVQAATLNASRGELSISLSSRSVRALQRMQRYLDQDQLLTVEFTTCDEYFFALRSAARAVAIAGVRGVMFLAAAVSDFYARDKATHKIQSSEGPLTLVLQQTPKLLRTLRDEWCPRALCVSFKLETDSKILLRKAQRAITKYGMDAVVANLLQTRYDQVTIVTRAATRAHRRNSPETEIEAVIVKEIAALHDAALAEAKDADPENAPSGA